MKKQTQILNLLKTFVRTKLNPLHYRKCTPANMYEWLVQEKPIPISSAPRITWIGHSSFLIQINGINILTDPIFYKPSFMYPRFLSAGIAPEQLPSIDIVVISHNHPDHMHPKSLYLLKKHNPLFLIPQGDAYWFAQENFAQFKEHAWNDSHSYYIQDAKITCTFVPARHWTGRTPFTIDASLCGGWVIQSAGHTLYFAGDTAYDQQLFHTIKKDFGKPDIAFLPISPNKMRSLVKHSHTNAAEAGQALLDLDAIHFIPTHWGTFRINADTFEEPIQLLHHWWTLNLDKLTNKYVHVLKFGQAKQFD